MTGQFHANPCQAFVFPTALESKPDRQTPPLRVGIAGAGIAGATSAAYLKTHGLQPTVFDKGRSPGGRCATRLSRHNAAVAFDHGAQYFTARDPGFIQETHTWAQAGIAARWRPRYASITPQGCTITNPEDATTPLWTGQPRMTAIAEHLLTGIDTHYQQQITHIQRTGRGWSLATAEGVTDQHFDHLILAVPGPQLPALLGPHFPQARSAAERARMLPCWTLMLGFDAPVDLPFDAAKIKTDSPLGWLARNTAKPQRPLSRGAVGLTQQFYECWVLQAHHSWSQTHLNASPESVADTLFAAFTDLATEHGTQIPPPAFQKAHRWRYALAAPETPITHLTDPSAGLTIAGDWLHGGRIESAWLSGRAAAAALMAKPPATPGNPVSP